MHTEQTIDIAAPPERVWAVMSDVERWHEWTASITSVELLDGATSLAMGTRARIQQPRLPTVIWQVTSLEPLRSFEWQTTGPGARTLAGHWLRPHGAGTTVRLFIDQTGPIGSLIAFLYKGLTRRYIQLEIEGLKRRSESAS
jgi:uncharacterized membrane protein